MDEPFTSSRLASDAPVHDHHLVLAQLAHTLALADRPFEALLQSATETVARTLGVARVGLWLYETDPVGIRCLISYDRSGDDVQGEFMPLEGASRYFDALREERIIAATDVRTDPRTCHLDEAYLSRHHVEALLDAPIRLGGELVGVICHEHVEAPREWTEAEKFFAASVADVLALALETDRRQRAEDALRAKEHFLRRLIDTLPSPVFIKRRDGRFLLVNEAFAASYALAPGDIIGRRNADFHPDPEKGALYDSYDAETFEAGGHIDFPSDLRRHYGRGEMVWYQTRIVPIEAPDGEPCVMGVATEITQRKHYERELLASRDEAQEASRLKSSLLANMSHEIRTPLTSIIGFTEVLHDPDLDDDERRHMIELIGAGARRLLTTLNSVLDWAQLEAGGIQLSPEPVDLSGELRSHASLYEPLARARGLSFDVQLPGAPVPAQVDRGAFGRIVANLVSNALKFTPRGGVTLRLDCDGTTCRLDVADTGIGIDPVFMPRLFDEFKQASDGLGRTYEGNGLGLSITRRLVEMMGGTIEAQSTPGEGATFTVRLPRLKTTPPASS